MNKEAQSRYFAVVSGSLEKHARAELESFGATVHIELPRGLVFSASTKQLYCILYGARLVQRVLFTLLSFDCHSHKYLYQQARKNIDWPSIFSVDMSFGIICNVSNSFTRHSLYSSQKLKDAICDSFRQRFDARPSFTNQNPDILFNLHIHENRATIALDILGLSMHKRGYRRISVQAPLQETLAAAIVKLSGWEGETPLWDPMCGSGTLLAEALMHYCRIPAGYLRDNHRVKYLPDYDQVLWDRMISEENDKMRALPKGLIMGSDIDHEAITAARNNLQLLPQGGAVELSCVSIERAKAGFSGSIITNPPYGVRLGTDQDIIKLYNNLGDFLKQKCKGSTAYVLCGDKELIKALRLRAHWSKLLKNADLDTRLAKILIR
ncbi:MAG: THUMP domain-containing protein [Candidatus Cloacimonadaceae bacterium]|nr:THUMP domain-containing protein [Candidatus Cloacimonadota bacterium]MDY0127720.1 THUMP domain-containing protein [Candidatus Cloacimonadaceae bacterium]MCB5254044.1 THUMP domain-containing protein [Candidatus Cloacimonadota bacterium]MCK9178879.1 THUMP domain-containing protein [Candidatus Cloacimonadota bacterium]MCK9242242.1 THUMP domain-containing protein [Candidatus Cloacimonadota bacterium]